MGGSMIEIKPLITTHPVKKINKIVREHQKPPEQNQAQEHEKNDEDIDSNEPEQQHIDEIV